LHTDEFDANMHMTSIFGGGLLQVSPHTHTCRPAHMCTISDF